MRLIIDKARNAFENMAIDNAILKLYKEPVLRFYKWHPRAVSIGYFQSITDEVDLKKAKEKNIDVVRRTTGGGAVFHDMEITYSIIIEESLVPRNIVESYRFLCNPIIGALKRIGIKAEFKPFNDIIVDKRKISGSAQTRKNNIVLQHGTILFDVNSKLMFSVLKVPDEKIRLKLIKDINMIVCGINDFIKKKGKTEKNIENELIKLISKGFENVLKKKFVVSKLTKEEKNLAKDLEKRFRSKEWNFLR